MEKKMYCTEISNKDGMITVHQDGQFMHYKYRINTIIFFTIKNGEYTRLDTIPAFREKFSFTLDTEKLEKLPVKRVEKPKKEQFFFIDDTMFLRADAIGLREPKYAKRDKRVNHMPSVTSTNFTLEATWTWNDGFYTRELLWDIQDYISIRDEAKRKLEGITYMSYYFYNIDEIDKAIEILQTTKTKLKDRMEWWTNASVEDLVSYYKSIVKGGEENA